MIPAGVIDCHCHVLEDPSRYPLVAARSYTPPLATLSDRLVWGSNWPHPVWGGAMPNDGDLLDLFCEWVPAAAVRNQIPVFNPAQLYGFE